MNDISGKEFAKRAYDLIGLTYQQCDCIGVVRKALGLRIQGTNWLWRSTANSPKYRYLVDKWSNPPFRLELEEGLVIFRIKWDQIPEGYKDKPNAYHIGVLIYYDNSWWVIQSNPKTGVCLTDYKPEDWDGYGKMKYVKYIGQSEDNKPNIETLSDHEMLVAIYNKIMGRD